MEAAMGSETPRIAPENGRVPAEGDAFLLAEIRPGN